MDEINEWPLGRQLTDKEAMSLAISEAAKGLGFVSPNPAVGCVILDKNSCLIAKGHHEKYGGPHAEVNALNAVTDKDQLIDARVFVTLEPCAHFGKTPPCAHRLASLPLSEVIFGLYDPNPLVQGKGANFIRSAGIKTTHFLDQLDQSKPSEQQEYLEKLEQVCEVFLKNMKDQRPFISLKVATSLDGMLALTDGQSQWITGPESRLETHRLRAIHEGILVGVNTFLADNPSLNVRHPRFPQKKNRVIVLDPQGRGLLRLTGSKLLAHHEAEDIIWVTSASYESIIDNPWGIQIIQVPTEKGGQSPFELSTLLQSLWDMGLRSILVEGGAQTLSQFIRQKLADRLYLFMGPKLIGGQNGTLWTNLVGPIKNLGESQCLSRPMVTSLGDDILITGKFLNDPAS